MTTEELNSIVSEVMAQIEANALDFDIVVSEAQDNDYLTVARYNESDGTYKGLVITWKDVVKVVTDVAVQAKTDAVNAKDIAQQILNSVTTKGTEITNFVATSKSEIETQKNESVKTVQSIYRTDLNAINDRITPIDFRITDPNKVILDVDVTPTMEAFVDGMEQEPNEAIALTLEPDVPTVGSHNFGVRGQICIDGNYLYVCVADNTWKKIPLQEL